MKKLMLLCMYLTFTLLIKAQEAPINAASFSIVNLDYPGLETAKINFNAKKYDVAAKALLDYYRARTDLKDNNFVNSTKSISAANQQKADNSLLHKFQPHKGYGFFDYGKDINWQLWPVKDNEVRWQLHRVTWWESMGLAYRKSSNEEYAREWVFQFRDWVKKNPLGLSADNDRYAWRALEISERLKSLPNTFGLFLSSPNFTPTFLMDFLQSYNQQAEVLPTRYAEEGNHRLFEAQRELAAGAFFPELKAAAAWRKSGVEILNTEIKKQVFDDGMQWELAPGYHNAMISTFLAGLRAAQQAGLEKEFPASYKSTIEKMVLATINFSFPDYTFPMFGDAWLTDKSAMLKQYKDWAIAFPDNQVIRYFSSDGKKGTLPSYLSKALTDAGFYTFRNGWDRKSTVMVLKASPPGEFHAQPDNGTFELWIKGRNFMPDAGCFVYSGDAEINKLREEYRQTKVHNTLTLNDKSMVITKAKLEKWESNTDLDILTYSNPSYSDMSHQRSILFIDQHYFLIIDRAIGIANGKLAIRFHLKEDSNPHYNRSKNTVYTSYTDGNNLLIQSLNLDKINLLEEKSKVSYQYRKELERPALGFEKEKPDGKQQTFISILYPYSNDKVPAISLIENPDNDYASGKLDITLTIDGKTKMIKEQLYSK
ncbi:heparin-sulfate lyase HepC [Sphingobacterium sp. JUb56]|uniref:heparin-sulfate lyase HepC n=1 Tax=Sphingobacterium sp. JUb56 TaxID=2587145 RepID=UPI00161EB1D9|nr:heparin-sulfate lyase HepC [Sphingobacterium sp. JUb56]MBB2952187.1 heparan-sulfate lyase [Sphingobacterium sp. JUb56]